MFCFVILCDQIIKLNAYRKSVCKYSNFILYVLKNVDMLTNYLSIAFTIITRKLLTIQIFLFCYSSELIHLLVINPMRVIFSHAF